MLYKFVNKYNKLSRYSSIPAKLLLDIWICLRNWYLCCDNPIFILSRREVFFYEKINKIKSISSFRAISWKLDTFYNKLNNIQRIILIIL